MPQNLEYYSNLVERFHSLPHPILGHLAIFGPHYILMLFVKDFSALHQSIGLLHDFHRPQGERSDDGVHIVGGREGKALL